MKMIRLDVTEREHLAYQLGLTLLKQEIPKTDKLALAIVNTAQDRLEMAKEENSYIEHA